MGKRKKPDPSRLEAKAFIDSFKRPKKEAEKPEKCTITPEQFKEVKNEDPFGWDARAWPDTFGKKRTSKRRGRPTQNKAWRVAKGTRKCVMCGRGPRKTAKLSKHHYCGRGKGPWDWFCRKPCHNLADEMMTFPLP